MQIVAATAVRRSDSILVYVMDTKRYYRLTLGTMKEGSDPKKFILKTGE